MGNSGLVTLVELENDGMTRSIRWLSGASRPRVSLLSLPSRGCGMAWGLDGAVPALVGVERAAREPLWLVHPPVTSAASMAVSSITPSQPTAAGGRAGPSRRCMSPSLLGIPPPTAASGRRTARGRDLMDTGSGQEMISTSLSASRGPLTDNSATSPMPLT
jgi:hypothetical protein